MANIRISWTPNPENQLVSAYRVFESVDGGSFDLVATVTEPTVVRNVSGGVRKWKVQAVNFVGDSPLSESVDGPGLPTAPTGLILAVE